MTKRIGSSSDLRACRSQAESWFRINAAAKDHCEVRRFGGPSESAFSRAAERRLPCWSIQPSADSGSVPSSGRRLFRIAHPDTVAV